eukprot:80529_1
MSADQFSTKWIYLTSCPSSARNCIIVPTAMDKNNYIIIDYCDDHYHNLWDAKIIDCIHKYDIDNDKWIKINGFNNMENISSFSAALDVTKKILYLFCPHILTQIQLNNNNITNHTHNIEIYTG